LDARDVERTPHYLLLAGPGAALVFGAGVAALGLLARGYNPVRQTVSELGELGAPLRAPLAAVNLLTALAMALFAAALFAVPERRAVTAAFLGLAAICGLGLAAFPSKHPLHNMFGPLQTFPFIGAPLSVALGARDETLAAGAWLGLTLILCAMALNLAPLFSTRAGKALAPVYGLAQRALFVGWYGWCAALGALLFARS
jgi:hypothetical protein